MGRPVVGDMLRDAAPTVAPQAAPVDVFSRPSQKSSRSAALLGALGKLDKVVNPLLEEYSKEAREREFSEGQQAFKANRKAFKDAVRDGDLPAGASPWVNRGYRTSQLKAQAGNYAVMLSRALDQSNLEETGDPQEIEQFMQEFYSDFAEKNGIADYDPVEVQDAFLPTVTQAHEGFRKAHMQRHVKWVEDKRFEAYGAELVTNIDVLGIQGGFAIEGNRQQLNQTIMQAAATLDAEGLDRTKITKATIDIITNAAVNRSDLSILQSLKEVNLGTAPLGNTAYGRSQMARARETILNKQEAAARRRAAAEKRRRGDMIKNVENMVMNSIMEGDEPMVEEGIQFLRDNGEALAAYTLMGKSREFDQWTDEEAFEENYAVFRAAIFDEAYVADRREAAGILVRDYGVPVQYVEQWTRSADDLYETPDLLEFLRSAPIKETKQNLDKAINGSGVFKDITGEQKNNVVRAQTEFEERMQEYYFANELDLNTNAGRAQMLAENRRLYKEIYEKYKSDGIGSGFGANPDSSSSTPSGAQRQTDGDGAGSSIVPDF